VKSTIFWVATFPTSVLLLLRLWGTRREEYNLLDYNIPYFSTSVLHEECHEEYNLLGCNIPYFSTTSPTFMRNAMKSTIF
jgi:hypothetical protein